MARPTAEQLEWAKQEIGVIIHYDIQVFEQSYKFRKQWGYQPDAEKFNPAELDTDQWLETARRAEAKYAILVAKHLYGGMGYNPFNPAMAAYVVLLISFPVQMTTWAPPRGAGELPGLLAALQACFTPAVFDGTTMATPLDLMKQNNSLLIEDLWQQNPQFGRWAGLGWEWVNIAFLAGGLWLLYQRIFTWHAPVAMLASLTLFAAIFYDGGSSASGLCGSAWYQ